MQTKDTTALENMTGILPAAHGGTGKNTPLTADDVGAVEKGSGDYLKSAELQNGELVLTFGSGDTVHYTLPAATTTTLGGVKLSDDFTADADGTLHLAGGTAPDPYPVGSIYPEHRTYKPCRTVRRYMAGDCDRTGTDGCWQRPRSGQPPWRSGLPNNHRLFCRGC